LETLNRHERKLPPFLDVLKSEYVIRKTGLDDPNSLNRQLNLRAPLNQAVGADLITTGRDMPWEKMRSERIFNAVEAGYFRAAERYYREVLRDVLEDLRPGESKRQSLLDRDVSAPVWQQAPSGDTESISQARLQALLRQSWIPVTVGGGFPNWERDRREDFA